MNGEHTLKDLFLCTLSPTDFIKLECMATALHREMDSR
jgi:hypothetical protein